MKIALERKEFLPLESGRAKAVLFIVIGSFCVLNSPDYSQLQTYDQTTRKKNERKSKKGCNRYD